MLDNYIILDFETANFERTSICQIGMVKVIDNVVVDTMDQLILPFPNYFDSRNIAVHGIREQDVQHAPTFIEFYEEFNNFIDGMTIICHNASFDMSCLNKTLQYYNVNHDYNFMCTLIMCRRLLNFESNALTYLSQNVLDFKYQAHDALSDCLATQELIKYLKNNYNLPSVLQTYKIGKIDMSGYNGFKKGKNV